MIDDFSEDVKTFLLEYTSIDQLRRNAENEMRKVYVLLEAEIAKEPWFSPIEFQTDKSWRCVQVWKKKWQPSTTPNCPWIHFEYNLSWPNQWIQASVDIESQKIASWDTIKSVANHLIQLLSESKLKLLEGQGWNIKHVLEEKRMVLINRKNIEREKFTAEWIFNNGKNFFNQLSEVIPFIDKTVDQLFI